MSQLAFFLVCFPTGLGLAAAQPKCSGNDLYTMILHTPNLQETVTKSEPQLRVTFPGQATKEFFDPAKTECKVLGVLGLYNKGKTWLINRVFGINLCSGNIHDADTQGLSMTYIPSARPADKNNWLLVDTAGLQRPVSLRPDSTKDLNDTMKLKECEAEDKKPQEKDMCKAELRKKRMNRQFIYKSTTEKFVFELVNRISDVIIFVVNDYTWYEQQELFRLVRINYAIDRQHGKNSKEMMVAHIFKHTANTADARKLFDEQVRQTVETGNDALGKNERLIYDEEYVFPLGNGQKISIEVLHYGFGNDRGVDSGLKKQDVEDFKKLNAESTKAMQDHLKIRVPTPKKLRLTERLETSSSQMLQKWLKCKTPEGQQDNGHKVLIEAHFEEPDQIEPRGAKLKFNVDRHLHLTKDGQKLDGWWKDKTLGNSHAWRGAAILAPTIKFMEARKEATIIKNEKKSCGAQSTSCGETHITAQMRETNEKIQGVFKDRKITWTVGEEKITWEKERCELIIRNEDGQMGIRGEFTSEESTFDPPLASVFEYLHTERPSGAAELQEIRRIYALDVPGVGDSRDDDYGYNAMSDGIRQSLWVKRDKIPSHEVRQTKNTMIKIKEGITQARELPFDNAFIFNPDDSDDFEIFDGVMTLKGTYVVGDNSLQRSTSSHDSEL